MKTIELYIRYSLIVSLSILSGFLSGSCQDNDDIQASDTDAAMVTFSVKVPGSSTPSTYALNTNDENEVKSIEILLFDTNGKYVYQPIFSNVINTDPIDSKIKTFTVKVPEGTYNIVVLANSRQPLSNTSGSFSVGDTKASVLDKLIITNAGKWNANSASGGYIPMPMWGEIASITINQSTPANNPVNLIRMVSKIDVTLTGTAATDNLKLKSIRLYNYNNQGRIAPDAANWNQSQNIVTNPSVPSTSALTLGPLLYDGTSITTTDVSSIGEIYTFEAVKANPSSLGNATCLVIGGIYTGDSQPTYYRVDFAQTSSTTTYLSLLRNHHYKVNISEVSGPGLATPADAFNSRPVNIKAEIIEWNDGQISDIVFDGQYMLGVSQGEFTLPRNELTASNDNNALSITTDYPSGWLVDKIVDTGGSSISWLSLVSLSGTPVVSGASGSTTNVKLKLTENISGSARIGFIHLKAGRLAYVVKVTQGINTDIALNIKNAAGTNNITELVFAAPINTQPVSQQFRIKWSPASFTVTSVNSAVGSAAFSFDGASDQPGSGALLNISDPSGEKLFTIRPTAIVSSDLTSNPFLEKISKVDFTLFNGETYLSKSIFLRQSTYNLVFSNVSSSYWTNGSAYTFNVRSNANWRIKSISQQLTSGTGSLLNLQVSDNLVVGATGSSNTNPGTPVTFRVASNIVSLAGQLTVVFESPDSPKKFDDVTLVLNLSNEYYPAAHKGWAGSNIYYDTAAGHLTFDDTGVTTHKNYQGVYFLGGSLYGISPVGDFLTSTVIYPPLGGTTTMATWGAIPYLTVTLAGSNPPAGKSREDRAHLYEMTDGPTGVGDICKYLTDKGWAPAGKKWRMPTSSEFYPASGAYTMAGTFGNVTSTQTNGSFSFSMGYNKADIGAPFFPAAGYRNLGTGILINTGSNACYWSSSSIDASGYFISFGNNNAVNPGQSIVRGLGFSVRCVVE